jgi:hypothetical protein
VWRPENQQAAWQLLFLAADRQPLIDCQCAVCSCEFGWEGYSCNQLRLPACRNHEAEGAVMSCGYPWQPRPRNCECIRQCDTYLTVSSDDA